MRSVLAAARGSALMGGMMVAALSWGAGGANSAELAQSDSADTASQADRVGVTPYMSCKAFLGLIAADYHRAVASQSEDSNRVLEHHTTQMMELLQPYAVVGPNGRPLDFVWGYLVNTLDGKCKAHPDDRLDDAIRGTGQAMIEAVEHVRRAGQPDSAVADTQASRPDDVPPALPPASLIDQPSLSSPDPGGRDVARHH